MIIRSKELPDARYTLFNLLMRLAINANWREVACEELEKEKVIDDSGDALLETLEEYIMQEPEVIDILKDTEKEYYDIVFAVEKEYPVTADLIENQELRFQQIGLQDKKEIEAIKKSDNQFWELYMEVSVFAEALLNAMAIRNEI